MSREMMITLIILCFSTVLIHSYNLDRTHSNRIIEGHEASRGQFPWDAFLTLYPPTDGEGGFIMNCGGVLVSPRWVLSAAHCIDGMLAANVTLGFLHLNETDVGITVNAESAVIHENYSAIHLDNDIALLKLDQEIELSVDIQVLDIEAEYIEDGVDVTVSGWGVINDHDFFNVTNTLMYANLKTISNSACAEIYGDRITEGKLCCIGNNLEGVCNGDSGGPLITGSGSNAKLVGIVSFGSDRGCKTKDPSGFTRISTYYPWILNTINNDG